MSGNPLEEVHEKKIVRYYVRGGERCGRTFKKHLTAVWHAHDLTKKGFTNVEIYKNTKIYKTERIK